MTLKTLKYIHNQITSMYFSISRKSKLKKTAIIVSKFILLMSNSVSRRLNSFKFSAVDSLLDRLFHAIAPLYRMECLVLLV